MVNLADLDTSFLVPCRHCGDLMPEQDRICPHCGKDQQAVLEPGAGDASARRADQAALADPMAAARDVTDFAAAGTGSRPSDGPARRRRKVIGVVALLAGVLLLGMAYDRYVKRDAARTAPALAQEAPPAPPATAAGPVVSTPSANASASTAEPAAVTPATPAAADAADTSQSACNEALAALSLCTRP